MNRKFRYTLERFGGDSTPKSGHLLSLQCKSADSDDFARFTVEVVGICGPDRYTGRVVLVTDRGTVVSSHISCDRCESPMWTLDRVFACCGLAENWHDFHLCFHCAGLMEFKCPCRMGNLTPPVMSLGPGNTVAFSRANIQGPALTLREVDDPGELPELAAIVKNTELRATATECILQHIGASMEPLVSHEIAPFLDHDPIYDGVLLLWSMKPKTMVLVSCTSLGLRRSMEWCELRTFGRFKTLFLSDGSFIRTKLDEAPLFVRGTVAWILETLDVLDWFEKTPN